MMKQPRQRNLIWRLKFWTTHQARLITHGLENRAKTSRTIIPCCGIHVMLLVVNSVAWPERHAQNFGNVRAILAENLPSQNMNISCQIDRRIHIITRQTFESRRECVNLGDIHKTQNVVTPNDPKLSHGTNKSKREFAANLQMQEQPPLAPARC